MIDYALDFSVIDPRLAPSKELPAAQIGKIVQWLLAFQNDDHSKVVFDHAEAIFAKYVEQYGDQCFAIWVIVQKKDAALVRHERVRQTPSGDVLLGKHWDHLDTNRRWLAGVAARRPELAVANATHKGWHADTISEECEEVFVEHLLEKWLDAEIEKDAQSAKKDTVAHYHIPPTNLLGELASAKCVGAGINGRRAWEDAQRRYEFDRQHNTVEVYSLATKAWLHEAQLDGTVIKTTGGEGRYWGKN